MGDVKNNGFLLRNQHTQRKSDDEQTKIGHFLCFQSQFLSSNINLILLKIFFIIILN